MAAVDTPTECRFLKLGCNGFQLVRAKHQTVSARHPEAVERLEKGWRTGRPLRFHERGVRAAELLQYLPCKMSKCHRTGSYRKCCSSITKT